MLSRSVIAFGSLVLALSVGATDVGAQFSGLTGRIPSGANSLVVIDASKAMSSPLAQKENWRENRENAAASGVTILPPSADQFVMAAKMDLEFVQPVWEVALAKVRYAPDMPKLAARFGGSIDHVENKSAALLADDFYVVKFTDSMVGAMRPGSRQSVARWLRETRMSSASNDQLSPYLQQALKYAEEVGTPIIMALDLTDAFSPEVLREKGKDIQALQGSGLELDQVAKAVSSIQGVTLGITIKDSLYGAIRVVFSENVEFLRPVAKRLLLEVLARQSAMIDEFQNWEAQVEGQRIQIGGNLYPSGMQRIMSVLDAPEALHSTAQTSSGEQSDENLKALSSQQYFNSVGGLLENLLGRDKQTMGQVGVWCGRYAKRIDGLPLLNVDERLLDYGTFVADALRQAEAVLRGVGGRSRVRELNAPAQYRSVGRWGSNGWYGTRYYGGWAESPRLEAQNQVRIRTEERVQGASSAREIVQQINQATAAVRREMTQKYNVEF